MSSEDNGAERQEIRTHAHPGFLADPGVESAPLHDWQLAHDSLVAEVLRLRAENRDLHARLAATIAMLTEMVRHRFGIRSERRAESPIAERDHPPVAEAISEPPSPSAAAGCTTLPAPESEAPDRRPRGQQPGQAGHGRRLHGTLPTRHRYLNLPDEAQQCPRCGQWAEPCGTETSEQLDYVVRIERVQYHRQRYRYRCECHLEPSPTGTETESAGLYSEKPSDPVVRDATEESAPSTPAISNSDAAAPASLGDERPRARSFAAPRPVSVIPRGIFSINFLVQVLAWKYAWGVPLHRLRKQWASQGTAISAGSLVGALEALGPVLAPLYDAIKAVNRSEDRWNADETHWKVFVDRSDKSGYRWWLWVFIGVHSTVFILSPTRSAQVPKGHLQALSNDDEVPAGLHKILQTDNYSGYRAMRAGLIHAWCWAHIRRRFFAAWKSRPELTDWSQAWLDRIGELYHLYTVRAQAATGSAAWDRADEAVRAWVQSTRATWGQELAEPSLAEPARKILATVQRQWEGLTQFVDYPEIPLDNNEAERLLRTPVVGRKNYYGSRAEWSGHLAAMVWTLWATAEQNGWNPVTYLTRYFTAYAENGNHPLAAERLQEFLPTQPSTATG